MSNVSICILNKMKMFFIRRIRPLTANSSLYPKKSRQTVGCSSLPWMRVFCKRRSGVAKLGKLTIRTCGNQRNVTQVNLTIWHSQMHYKCTKKIASFKNASKFYLKTQIELLVCTK